MAVSKLRNDKSEWDTWSQPSAVTARCRRPTRRETQRPIHANRDGRPPDRSRTSRLKPPVTPHLGQPDLVDKIDPLLRRKLVLAVTGLSQSQLYRLIRAGEFPRPVKVSEGSVGWRQSQVAAWIMARPEVVA